MQLEGIRVVDLTRILAGPFCSMFLADLGAEVIKIEDPDGGDPIRSQGEARNGFSLYFANFNRNKRSVTCDIATPAEFSETLHASHGRYRTWGKLKDLLARLNPSDPRAHLQANALASLFAKKELQTPEEAESAFNAFSQTDTLVRRT